VSVPLLAPRAKCHSNEPIYSANEAPCEKLSASRVGASALRAGVIT